MSNKPAFAWAFTAVLLFAAAAAWAEKPPTTVDQIALVVDQESMTQGEIDEAIKQLFDAQGMKVPPPGNSDYEQAKKDIVEAFIREVLLAEEADREKIEISDDEVDRATDQQIEEMKKRFSSDTEFEDGLKAEGLSQDDLRQDIHDQLLRRMKANRVLQMKQHDLPESVFVTDEEVKKYFDLHPQDFAQVKFSIILFRIPSDKKKDKAYLAEVGKQAQDLLKQIKGGADFATMAKKYSEDEGSREKGGEVGAHFRVDLDPKLADGVFAIPVNGLGVVKTPEGVYLVKVTGKGTADYDSVAPDIKDHLHKQKQESAFSQWLDGLRKNAYIVEDGKEIAFKPAEEENTGTPPAAPGSTASAATSETSNAKGTMDNNAPATLTPVAGSTPTASKALYPTLPEGGSFALELGADGFSYGTQDLSNYYGPSVSTAQGFPFGFGLHTGLDFAVDPTFEVGGKLEFLRKLSETVNFSPAGQPSYSEVWTAEALGGELNLKILVPLDESTNFILSAGGGYYFLTSGGVTVAGSAVTENADFTGSNFGGEAGGTIEFFLDGNKDSTIGLDVGYRYLKFQPVTSNLTVNDGGPISSFPSPLLNGDGSQALIDFSGLHVGVGFKFYIDKLSS